VKHHAHQTSRGTATFQLPHVSGNCLPVSFFMSGKWKLSEYPGDLTRRPEEENLSWFRGFRLALKVL
jgi:hypothetical protein